MKEMLSEHFSRDELECPCCSACEMKTEFLTRLETLRARLARPLAISSGFRCTKHNQAAGGKTNSRHLSGEAVDIRCADSKTAFEIVASAIFCGFGGIGVGHGFIHVDNRPTKDCRLWYY